MTKPIKAEDLLSLDPMLQVEVLQCYPIPEQVVYQAAKCDYSETPIHSQKIPAPSECGRWIVEQLLNNERGHYGPLEHPHITFSTSGYVHSVMVQARTHRIGISFDCQSQRYTSQRVIKVAKEELPVNAVFYIRPPGFYTNRQGKKYNWSQENYFDELEFIKVSCIRYAEKFETGIAEEHLRDYLPQAIRQNFVMTVNLRSILHLMDLRAKLDAQLEIGALMHQIAPFLRKWAPNVWDYYEEKRLHRGKLAP